MPAKLDRCVTKVKKSFVDKYVKKNGKQPSVKLKKKYENSAWAICKAEEKDRDW